MRNSRPSGYDPHETRQLLLNAAFDEIYDNGFRSAGIDSILAESGLTKGALYHHFGNKTGLGYSVIEERVMPLVRERYLEPFRLATDPIHGLKQMAARMEQELLKVGILKKGCPVNNLIQEMSGVDEGFRERLTTILTEWENTISEGLRAGQARKTVRKDLDVEAAATFIVSSLMGACGISKSSQNIAQFSACRSSLDDYVESFRPQKAVAR